MAGDSRASLLTRADSHPLILDLLVIKTFGPQAMAWEPETIKHEIKLTFGADVSDASWAKIQAARTAHGPTTPYEQWEENLWVIHGLNGYPLRPDYLQLPSVGELLFGVYCLEEIRDDVPFSEEVTKGWAALLRYHGLAVAPPLLSAAQAYLDGDDKAVLAELERALHTPKEEYEPTETPEGIQAFRLLTAYDYLDLWQERLTAQAPILAD